MATFRPMSQAEHDAMLAQVNASLFVSTSIGTWLAKVCDNCGAYLSGVHREHVASRRPHPDDIVRCRECDPETWHRLDLEEELTALNDRVEGAVYRQDEDAVAIVRRMLELMVELGWNNGEA